MGFPPLSRRCTFGESKTERQSNFASIRAMNSERIGSGPDTLARSRRSAMRRAVLFEFWLTGTDPRPPRTPNGEIAPTGKTFRVRRMASFEFAPGSATIICERPYFDRRAMMTALGLG